MRDSTAVPAVTPAAAKDNAELREFVERWKRAGALLEADRWQRLCGATEVELNATAWDVLGLWQADLAGDDGEAIRIQQRLFARLAAREPR